MRKIIECPISFVNVWNPKKKTHFGPVFFFSQCQVQKSASRLLLAGTNAAVELTDHGAPLEAGFIAIQTHGRLKLVKTPRK
jgi:hypothetical protein